ncbi:hypothetical protein SALBM311S_03901 [Streptomyces alboniger]
MSAMPAVSVLSAISVSSPYSGYHAPPARQASPAAAQQAPATSGGVNATHPGRSSG